MSANSGSVSHCRSSTTMRWAKANPPLKPHNETCRKTRDKAPSATWSRTVAASRLSIMPTSLNRRPATF